MVSFSKQKSIYRLCKGLYTPGDVGLVVMIAAFHRIDQRQSRVQFPDISFCLAEKVRSVFDFVSGMGYCLDREMRLRCGARKEHLEALGLDALPSLQIVSCYS
jgi:hypothetical protein